MHPRTPTAVEDRIIDTYRASRSTRLAAESAGVSMSTVRRILERRGERLEPSHAKESLRKTTPDQDAEMVERYMAGESGKVLAREYGFRTHVSVLKRVRAAGVDVARRGGRVRKLDPEQEAKILALREGGATQERIAREVGVGQTRVSAFLRSVGLRTWDPSRHPAYRGGGHLTEGGYLAVRIGLNDPLAAMAQRSGYVLEHRLVMARALGRPLLPWETVHHIDGDRQNNELGNLQLRQGRHGTGVALRCLSCGSHDIEATPLA